MSKVRDCGDSANSLMKEIDECITPNKSSIESCQCFVSLTNTNLQAVIECNIDEERKIATDGKKKCVKGILGRIISSTSAAKKSLIAYIHCYIMTFCHLS